MSILYLDNDPNACAWLEELVKAGELLPGEVWCRDLTTVKAKEVERFTQRHWCCGIGGWPLAMQMAGWSEDRPVDSVSLPCQPWSSAGKQKGKDDERHLWPQFFELVRRLRPVALVGEQVPAAIKAGWLDGVFDALEGEGYSCGAVVLPACSVGAPHIRQRIFWLANAKRDAAQPWRAANRSGQSAGTESGRAPGQLGRCGVHGGLSDPSGMGIAGSAGRQQGRPASETSRYRGAAEPASGSGGLSNASGEGMEGYAGDGYDGDQPGREHVQAIGPAPASCSPWADFDLIPCADGKARRIKRGVKPLAHGLPRGVVSGCDISVAYAENTGEARVMRLKGYGNAIVPQLAAVFLEAVDTLTP